MKRSIITIIVVFVLGSVVYADSAPIFFTPGGNVVPARNNDIQMQSEVITISLYPDYYIVNVDYVFVNHGDSQKVTMGFPSSSIESTLATIEFSAYFGEETLHTYICEGSWEFENYSKLFYADDNTAGIDQFKCFNIEFSEEETKEITNTYKSKYGICTVMGEEKRAFYNFQYILQTGSLWRDSIESVQLVINTDNLNEELMLEHSYFQDNLCSFRNFDTTYVDIEPNFDFNFIVKRAKDFIPSSASSTLFSQGEYNYDISNIDDHDVKTAWIEGVSGYGVGEKICFNSNIINGFGLLSMQIDSIGFISGYTFNDTVFEQNSRVRKIKISVGEGTWNKDDLNTLGKYLTNSYMFELKDIPEMQYLVFDPPISGSKILFEILDVYEGSKYADTAISEIEFYINQKVEVKR